jgi:uncharacterized protein YukE
MRITAQQVVKDIDNARNELRRAILELPEETRSNADAMRRVVSDQISALNALADVVKRQSSTLDLSGPGIYLSQHPRETGPGKFEGAPSTAPMIRTQGAQQVQPERDPEDTGGLPPAALRLKPVDELLKAEAASDSVDLLPHLKREITGRPAEARDLSREIESLVAKLNGAARDLVEALDGSLSNEFEKRYNQGETHVYMHQLYIHRGAKLLKSVQSRYGSVRLVRGRVDAFIRLFERLLDTVTASPNGEQMVDTCLASEAGKLYLLFAQAAGRIH